MAAAGGRKLKRQTVLVLLTFVSQSLKNIEILHSQLVHQLQELESRENLQDERTLQGIKSQLIKRGKHLKNCARHQKRILFQIEETKLFWIFKKKKIISLLEKYSWDSLDRITKVFEDWTESLLNLEKQLTDLNYSLLKTEELNNLIRENLLDKFIEFNRQNEDNCDNMDRAITSYNLMAEYETAKRDRELNLDYLQSLKEKVLALREEEKLTSFQAAFSTI